MVRLRLPYTEAKYTPLFQTIPKAESPLSFFGDEVPTGAKWEGVDKSYYQYRSHMLR
jgi:hypothetical protein